MGKLLTQIIHQFTVGLLSTTILIAASSSAIQAQPQQPAESPGDQKLSKMFSKQIRKTLEACGEKGGVNLAAGADKDGSVICAAGDRNTSTAYQDYLATFSDFVSAGFLVGFRTALKSSPSTKPEAISAKLSGTQGQALLKELLSTALATNQVFANYSAESKTLLLDEVLKRTQPTLQDPKAIEGLIGTSEQYAQAVKVFCNPPGTSASGAQAKVPGLSSVQLYSICIEAAGLSDTVIQPSESGNGKEAPSPQATPPQTTPETPDPGSGTSPSPSRR
jgi:hypothetical protein